MQKKKKYLAPEFELDEYFLQSVLMGSGGTFDPGNGDFGDEGDGWF